MVAESGRAIIEVDKAKAAIAELLQDSTAASASVDAGEVVKAARVVAAATGDLVVTCSSTSSQEALVDACHAASSAVAGLICSARGAASLADQPHIVDQLNQATKVPYRGFIH